MFSFLICLVSVTVSSVISRILIDKYRINKKFVPSKINKIYLSPDVKLNYKIINIDEKYEGEIKNCIDKFINVICSNFNEDDLGIFYNNINKLKIKKYNFLYSKIFNKNVVGEYFLKRNTIKYLVNETIYHELFHMASSYYKDGVYYFGFYQSNGNKNIGAGLNEGFTEFLAEEYFNVSSSSYNEQVSIIKRLIKVICKDKMISLYLRADLYGLIKELEKYSTYDEIMRFISNTDFMLSDSYKESNDCIKKKNNDEIEMFLKNISLNKKNNNKIYKKTI